MLVYVDFVSPLGLYRAGRHPATVDPSMPLGVLCAAAFLEASGAGPRADACRLFHLEGDRFIGAGKRAGELGELDTVIVANTDDLRFADRRELVRRWQRHGQRATALGFERRRGSRGRASA